MSSQAGTNVSLFWLTTTLARSSRSGSIGLYSRAMTAPTDRPLEGGPPNVLGERGRQGDRGPAGQVRGEIEERDGVVGDAASGKTAIEAAADMSAGPGGMESAGKDEEDKLGEQLATHHKNGLQDQTNYMCV